MESFVRFGDGFEVIFFFVKFFFFVMRVWEI